jgi:hypothetical protein
MNRWQEWAQLGNMVLLAVMAWMLISGVPSILNWRRQRVAPAPKHFEPYDWVDPAKGLKIIMFYAAPRVVVEGESASICYGVMNAKSVRIEPAVEELRPSFNRCIEVTPKRDTKYTLLAEDGQGKQVSESFELRVAPEPLLAPRIDYFRVKETKQDQGQNVHLLCFSTWNAEEVEVQPPAFATWKVLRGCFYAAPKQQTTYTLTARGTMGRQVSKRLTVAP